MSDLEKAARQALDALENLGRHTSERECDEAITALRAALAQQADAVACVCGDLTQLGIVHRADGPCFAPAPPKSFRVGYMTGYDDGLRAALEQAEPVVEPEHWVVTTKVGDIVGFKAPGLKKGDKVYSHPHPQQQAEPVSAPKEAT